MKKTHFVLFFLFCACQAAMAQSNWTTLHGFSKNRVQYKTFRWKTIKSNHFEINFHQGGEKIARTAAQHLENEYARITNLMSYTPFDDMKIYVYNTTPDADQSNMGISTPIALDGGMLNLAKSRIELAHNGNDKTLKKELSYQVTRLFVYDMLYGGTLKEALQSSLLLTVPDWFIEGVSTYVAEDWDVTKTQYVQQALVSGRIKRLSTLRDKDAQIIGQSIWHYIAQRYGKDNIGNILNLTRIIRSEQSAISSSVGVPFGRFIREWREYYQQGASAKPTQNATKTAKADTLNTTEQVTKIKLGAGEVDTENYEFDAANLIKVNTEGVSNKSKKENTTVAKGIKDAIKIGSPSEYENRFIATESINSLSTDPLRGLGFRPNVTFSDLLENHVLKAGLFVPLSFKNVDYFGEYYNLTNRIDYGFKVSRSALTDDDIAKYHISEVGVSVSYPFDKTSRMTFVPTYLSSRKVNIEQLGEADDLKSNVGIKTEYVFDNTEGSANYITQGLRAKVGYQYFWGAKKMGFNRALLDIRYYKSIFGKAVLAARFSASNAVGGTAPKVYLGGVDNYLKGKETRFERDVSSESFRDFYLSGLITPLRGYALNKVSGNSHLLTNIELRLPFSKLLGETSTSSNLLSSMQLVVFTDIGTAWSGKSPFSQQNNLNTETIGGGDNPFRATVTNFKNPFFVGYGIGARSNLLGYPIKADYSWSFEDKTVNGAVLQLSIGYDF